MPVSITRLTAEVDAMGRIVTLGATLVDDVGNARVVSAQVVLNEPPTGSVAIVPQEIPVGGTATVTFQAQDPEGRPVTVVNPTASEGTLTPTADPMVYTYQAPAS